MLPGDVDDRKDLYIENSYLIRSMAPGHDLAYHNRDMSILNIGSDAFCVLLNEKTSRYFSVYH